jgi:integrase
MVIPVALRPVLGRTELRYTLHTGSLSEAKYRARIIAAYVQELIRKAAGGSTHMQGNTPEQLQGLIRDFVADCLHNWESDVLSRSVTEDVWFAELDHLQVTKGEEEVEIATRDFRRVAKVADRALSAAGITLEPGTEDYNKLCMELLKASKLLSEVWIERHKGDYGRKNSQVITEAVSMVDVPTDSISLVAPPQPQPPHSALHTEKTPLKQVTSEYSTEKKSAGKWTPKTEQENLACYRLFLTWAGQGIVVEDITFKLMREYKAALQKLPANMEKSPQYRDKTIHELLALADQGQIPKVMGIATINKNLNRVSTVLAYAVKNGYISFNPAADMQVEQPKRDDEHRDTFSKEDLHALFHSPDYSSDTFKHPYQFWTPLLALFTGARQNELAQLYLDDLREEDGILVFDINGKLDKKLKTKNAARLVPVHPFMLELGLVRYAQELQAKGEVRLFPELTLRRDGYGQDVSRWFNGNGVSQGYRQSCGVEAAPGEPGKVFHSFRHTFINDMLKRKDMNESLLQRVVGHSFTSMTLGTYGKGRTFVSLAFDEVVSRADFHQTIPLDHLLKSKFARVEG